jgi:hypothetical protein
MSIIAASLRVDLEFADGGTALMLNLPRAAQIRKPREMRRGGDAYFD